MNNLLPKSLLLICFPPLLLLPASLLASDEEQSRNWYTVEVISFTRNKEAGMKEQWLDTATAATMEQDMSLEPGTPMAEENIQALPDPMIIQTVPENDWQLSRHAYSLGRSPELKIQSHQAWRQPGLSKEQSPWTNLASDSDQLTGKIRISLSRYLHAEVDISLDNPNWTPFSDPATQQPHWQQSRKIQFTGARRLTRDELHYIDHPLAGVLVRIERYELPAGQETGKPDAVMPKTNDSNSGT